MQLSKRMQAVAELVTLKNTVADIGTDHGYIPIYLIEQNVAKSAIAMDVRPGPLSHAKENIEQNGLSDRIETRLSDGLEKLQMDEADTVIIAGMGGMLTIRILENGLDVLSSVKELILQPQLDVDRVRRFLHTHDFKIVDENILIDDGKYYVMMRAVHGNDIAYDEVDDTYGKILIEKKNEVLKLYLNKQKDKIMRILEGLKLQSSEKSKKRIDELEAEEKLIAEALRRMEG